jgi:hypothetical protein
MVAHDVLRVVDHTTAIAGEQATGMNGVEITPRVDTVAAWHDTSLSLAATGTAGERRIPHRSRSVEADGDSLEVGAHRREPIEHDSHLR